jgi:hypothetical protein
MPTNPASLPKTFLYDRVFILMPGQTIPAQELGKALEAANDASEILITKRPSLDDVYREVTGAFHTSGLIPRTPNNEIVARLGVAWFCDERGHKHVRIASDAKKVKFYETNLIWPSDILVPNLVYPALRTSVEGNRMICGCGRSGSLGELQWNGLKCFECQENDRYAEETGFEKYTAAFPRRKD